MFNRCYFLLGQNDSVVIVVPERLPEAETYTVSVSDRDICFKAGHEKVTEFSYTGGEAYRRISDLTQIGLVEQPRPGYTPDHITKVAYVEVRRAAS